MVDEITKTQILNRKKSATYYEKHKNDILTKRKNRYENNKEELRAKQREYARIRRLNKKIAKKEQEEMKENDISAPLIFDDNSEYIDDESIEEPPIDIHEMLINQL